VRSIAIMKNSNKKKGLKQEIRFPINPRF